MSYGSGAINPKVVYLKTLSIRKSDNVRGNIHYTVKRTKILKEEHKLKVIKMTLHRETLTEMYLG